MEQTEYGLVAGYLKAGKPCVKKYRKKFKRNLRVAIGTDALHRWGIGPKDYLPKRKWKALCREHGKAMMEAYGRSLAQDMTIVNELDGPEGSLEYQAPPPATGTLLGGHWYTPDNFALRMQAYERMLKEEAYRPDAFTGIFRKTGMQAPRPHRRRKGLHSTPILGYENTGLGAEESLVIPDAIFLKLEKTGRKPKSVRVAMKTRLTGRPKYKPGTVPMKTMTMFYREFKKRTKLKRRKK